MNHAGGSVAAAPIWDEYMTRVHQGLPVENFVRPPGIQDITVDRLSNKLPGDGSGPIKDIFTTWQVPTEKDDVHVKVRVCRENGLLADSFISNELTEDRIFTNIHSEKPDNPNWEGPVIAWAKSAGLYNPPPTDKCQSGSVNPSVQITNPQNNGTVSDTFTISANASAPSGVKQVEFLIDGVSIGSDIDSPYSVSYNANQLSSGAHTLTATLTSNSGSTASDHITVTVSHDETPPGNVTNYTGIQGPGAGKVTLSWINPGDADFKSVKIYVYIDATSQFVRTVEVDKPGQTTTISSLTGGTAYRFTAKSVDNAGNESGGVSVVLTPL
jgi:hypothetical protein